MHISKLYYSSHSTKVTIPASIVRTLQLRPGDYVVMRITDDDVIELRPLTPESGARLKGRTA